MFNQYEPSVKATSCFLQLLQIKVNNATVNETLQNHPDWPSLLSISDAMNKWNVPNAAGKIEPTNIDELPVPFIAQVSNSSNPIAIVTGISNTAIQLLDKNYNKVVTELRQDFLKKWNGIYLIAEPNEHSGEVAYTANKKINYLKSLVPIAASLIGLLFSFLLLQQNLIVAGNAGAVNTLFIYLQYGVLAAGLIVTAMLLWYEIDKTNPLLQKVCTGIAKGNCNAILTGKQSKLFSWLSWSEVGFFYFAGGLMLLLLSPSVTNTIVLLAWVNLLALPYTVFSIYYQWLVAKQWCVLCLSVQALLVIAGINTGINYSILTIPAFTLSFYVTAIILYAIPVLLWYSIKPSILRLQEAKNTKRAHLRLKFNVEIFETLLKKQKQITISPDGLGIDIGNANATNSIIKVCNPYCGPCATAHPKIEALLEQNKNVKAKTIFTTPNDDGHYAVNATRHLMAAATVAKSEEAIKKSLDDWYLADKKDYDLFAAKHPLNGELLQQGAKIAAMEKWCTETGISFTPTIFVNGHQLPDAYSIEDLQYFLLE